MTYDEAISALEETVSDLRNGVIRVGEAEVFVPQRLITAVQSACDDLLSAGCAARQRGCRK